MSFGSKVKRDTAGGMRRRKVTHKIKVHTNDKQSTYFWQIWQYARMCYNFCLGYHQLTLKMRRPCFKLRVWLNQKTVKQHRFPWASEYPQIATKNMIYNLEQVLLRFYKGRKNGDFSMGYPKFKNRKEKPSIRLDNGRADVPVFKGKTMRLGTSWKYRELKLSEPLRFKDGEICQVVMTQELGIWYVSVTVEILEKIPEIAEEHKDINGGGDHGIGDTLFAYADENGYDDTWDNPRFYRENEEEIAQLDREIARSLKQNANKLTNTNKKRKEARRKLHRKVKNQREDSHHKMTTTIANMNIGRFVIESSNANAWARHPKLAKSTYDAAPGMITAMLAYKCEAKGIELEQADRHYASTKTCSNPECGWFWSDMQLSDRVFICQECGLVLDRDINAARNLMRWTKNIEQPASSGGDLRDGKRCSESAKSASVLSPSAVKSAGERESVPGSAIILA